MTKPDFVKSVQTEQLESLLRAVQIGQLIEYDTLTASIKGDVQQECRGNLTSARRILSRDGIEFGTIKGVGIQRLSPTEVVDSTVEFTKRSRRIARKGRERLTHVIFEELPDDKKSELLAHSSQLQAVEMFAAPKARKKIAGAVESAPLNIGQTLDLFK